MTIEEAIKTAIDYETRIRNIYRDAAKNVSDSSGRRILELLGDDEQRHIEYLKDRLRLWQETGKLSPEKLESTIPPAGAISKAAQKVESHFSKEERRGDIEILGKALKAEIETSDFYTQMVNEMTADAQQMFARFLEIEENHIAAVQAELDYLTKSGYWFDFKEFDMEEL